MHALKKSFLVALLLVSISATGYLLTRPDPVLSLTYPRGDFLAFYWGGRVVLEGETPDRTNIVAEELTEARGDWGDRFFIGKWLYPPTASLFLFPLGLFSEATSQTLYLVGQGICAIVLLAFCGYLSRSPIWGTLLCFGFATLSLHANLAQAALHPYLATLFVLSVYLFLERGHSVLAGILMGVVFCIKPVEWLYWGPLVAFTLPGDRSWNSLASSGCVVFACFVLSFALWGREPWLNWVDVLGMIKSRAYSFDRIYLLGSTVWLALALRQFRSLAEERLQNPTLNE